MLTRLRFSQLVGDSPAMLASPSLSLDLIVTAGGERVPIACNKSALAAQSGYFSHQLSLPSCPNAVDLPSVPADIFRLLLLFIYTGQLDVTEENVYQLVWYAQMLQIPRALLHCSHFLSSRPAAQPRLVRPVARPGLPLLSLPTLAASFYSDWVLRCSTSVTSFTSLPGKEPEETDRRRSGDPHTVSQESKENEGEPRATQYSDPALTAGPAATFRLQPPGLLDTAACDGPVKFHRVVNEYFAVEEDVKADPEQEETAETGETYTCVYCNHVFKSHYCYQKHKRRHINPVTVDVGDNDKRFLAMKDLNVQYFPCKICGAKFPSYYFVHKHKKMWHRDQLELEEKNAQEMITVENQ